jgi:hypothetical protein
MLSPVFKPKYIQKERGQRRRRRKKKRVYVLGK